MLVAEKKDDKLLKEKRDREMKELLDKSGREFIFSFSLIIVLIIIPKRCCQKTVCWKLNGLRLDIAKMGKA